ncbi:hypothetical protein BDU57DRAFT_501901 [Ampelomyces quisqualis]|uniref:Aminoglycoside phosphotransferase domain-containing protein n=1 Tax=Ampelomyces quisqualis TaxID=50730 RepID=A0A6A5QH93_AMPQU|nr:hypothetical protein BDU57DRAFT_501901 [Ampelomyces quisqualis]
MDSKQTNLIWSPEIALRTKEQVLIEDWSTTDNLDGFKIQRKRITAPLPSLETWTTFKPAAELNGVTIFYQQPSCPPLPTRQEFIDVATNDPLHKGAYLHDEAENLLYLAEMRPELRIPTLLAAWSIQSESDTPIYFFMMNYIEGDYMTDQYFASLPVHAQDVICGKLSSQLRYLRELPSEGYYGRVNGKGWLRPPPGLDTNTTAHHTVVGPCRTYEDFCSVMYRSEQVQQAIGYGSKEWSPFHHRGLTKLASLLAGWKPNEPRLTWIDPKIKNIIARPIQGDDGSEDWEVFLIDWECLGWYPAWLQALQVYRRCGSIIRDPANEQKWIIHRKDDVKAMVLKEFDPEPDWEKIKYLCLGSNFY